MRSLGVSAASGPSDESLGSSESCRGMASGLSPSNVAKQDPARLVPRPAHSGEIAVFGRVLVVVESLPLICATEGGLPGGEGRRPSPGPPEGSPTAGPRGRSRRRQR